MDREKYVDESWKETAQTEKELLKVNKETGDKAQPASKQEAPQPAQAETHTDEEMHGDAEFQINFLNYLTSLGFQAMIFLGEIPHPATNKPEKNLDQAKFIIDTLLMLRDKTKGNLTAQEENLLNASVYELQMKFVEIKDQETPKS